MTNSVTVFGTLILPEVLLVPLDLMVLLAQTGILDSMVALESTESWDLMDLMVSKDLLDLLESVELLADLVVLELWESEDPRDLKDFPAALVSLVPAEHPDLSVWLETKASKDLLASRVFAVLRVIVVLPVLKAPPDLMASRDPRDPTERLVIPELLVRLEDKVLKDRAVLWEIWVLPV